MMRIVSLIASSTEIVCALGFENELVGRVYLTDGNQYFNRPGPRLVETLQILAEVLHPKVFAPALEGAGWRKL